MTLKKGLLLLSVIVAASFSASAQTNDSERIYTSVEQNPVFPGGQAELLKFLSDNIQYPPQAAENGTEGKVVVQFVIEKDGHVGDAKIVRGAGEEFNQEAIRVCQSLPKFTPGRKDGQPVRVWFTVPVTFKIPENTVIRRPSK